MQYENFGELIKWPQCVIVGKKVTIDQAKEILRRCDLFFYGYGSNQVKYDKKLWKLIKFPEEYSEGEDFQTSIKSLRDWQDKYGMLDLEYLTTDTISTCFIGGLHGWCNPNGDIFFNDNIGKWPTWEEVHEDCATIAKAFPFLDMQVYLFNQEAFCENDAWYDYEKKCVGGFKIKDGEVQLLDPSEFLSPDSEYCKARFSNNHPHVDYLIQMKKEIFGEKADIDMLKNGEGLFIYNEIFFSVPEFMEYFDAFEFETDCLNETKK